MRIVIVDSQKKDRAMEKRILRMIAESGECRCELAGEASDGQQGCEMVREKKPDLVILDLNLPDMTGLDMLKELKKNGINTRVLVLTAEKRFSVIRAAIRLGVDDYLLKPADKNEIAEALTDIGDKHNKEHAVEKAISEESIFMGCINGQVKPDEHLAEMTRFKYGFGLEDPGAIFLVWLGRRYAQQREKVEHILKNAGDGNGFSVCVLGVESWHALAAVVYRSEGKDAGQDAGFSREEEVFQEHIIPALSGSIQGEMGCFWTEAEHMSEFLHAIRELRSIREWNLIFDRGTLISTEKIKALRIVPLKYPADLEVQIRRAVFAEDGKEIRKCYYRLYDIFRQKPYSPRDMKECLIRFNMAVLTAFKTQHEVTSELRVQNCILEIAEAMSWGEIQKAMEIFFQTLDYNAYGEKDDGELSPLIFKALQMVRKYYDQGITLEEIAGRLFVSEEYLSTQFKKETGMGFKETVKYLRIEKIKNLLLNTGLKLNQIAELTGYTDPKYMSRVFKEEAGLLPSEFRKSAR